jgi:hypothetical protein
MSSRIHVLVSRSIAVSILLGAGLAWLLLGPTPCLCADDQEGVARLKSPTGTLLQRGGAEGGWKAIASGSAVADRVFLLALPGAHAELKSSTGGARLVLIGNQPQLSPTPALESAVSLRKSSDLDLDVILDRGRILVANTKGKGPARVQVRARDEVWDLTLKEPGTQVTVELNGNWPPGIPFRAQYKKSEEPRIDMALLVVKGSVELRVDAQRHTMSAPPGPALYHFDSASGPARSPARLPELPPWVRPEANKSEAAQAVAAALKPLYANLAKESPDKALAGLLAAADQESDKTRAALDRELAVTGLGALDDLAHLVDALSDPKHPEVRAIAVDTLRHWIGRAPGQDSQLAKYLRSKDYSPAHTTILLQLLHSYGADEIDDPLTYDLLISYLRHEKLAVRELAAWHLYRLAPAGQNIAYDPAGPAEERDKAFKAWKTLIPNGKLPPEPKKKQ